MNWWWKQPKPTPPPPVIPKFERAPKEEPGIVVEENRDPSDSMILRIVKRIRERD